MKDSKKLDALLKAALDNDNGTSGGRALAFCLQTGLRLEELIHLRREDVTLEADLADSHIESDFAWSCTKCLRKNRGIHRTKNGRDRYVPLSRRAQEIARQQLVRLEEEEATPGQWLFPFLRHPHFARRGAGAQLTKERLEKALDELTKAVGIALPKQVGVHFVRHIALTRWEAAGLSEGQRDLASGHTATGVRKTYSHGERKALFQAFREKLD